MIALSIQLAWGLNIVADKYLMSLAIKQVPNQADQ